MKNNRGWGICCLFLMIWGCTSPDPERLPAHIEEKGLDNLSIYTMEQEPLYHISLEREQSFGDTEEALIGRMGDVAVDERGRVYIADESKRDIKVLEPNGSLITQIGRQGRGPGEFLSITDIQINENRLFVYDANQQKSVVFSLGTFDHDYNLLIVDNIPEFDELQDEVLYPIRYHVRNDDSILMIFRSVERSGNTRDWDLIPGIHHLYLMDEAGEIKSGPILSMPAQNQIMVPAPGRPTVGMYFDFLGRARYALSNDDHIFRTWTEDFLFKVFRPDGEYLRAFYYPVDGAPLTPEAAFNYQDSPVIREARRNVDFPDTWPVIDDFLIDDEDRIWVSTIVEDEEVYKWWVLDIDGNLISRITLPRNRSVEEVKNGYLYARESDEETGIQTVVRYRIEMKSTLQSLF